MKTPASAGSDHPAQRHLALSRRQFLRGVGACLSLPVLASAWRSGARAATVAQLPEGGLAVTRSGAPLRMAFVYFPNGAHQDNWWPTGEGKNFTLGRTIILKD